MNDEKQIEVFHVKPGHGRFSTRIIDGVFYFVISDSDTKARIGTDIPASEVAGEHLVPVFAIQFDDPKQLLVWQHALGLAASRMEAWVKDVQEKQKECKEG